jgi:hypothetical protein
VKFEPFMIRRGQYKNPEVKVNWDFDRMKIEDDMKSEYSNIPDAILLAINNHVLRGQNCGHFVTAVLSNDLIEAVNRADDECQKCLRSIVRYLYNRCPGGCWGSKKKMEEWRENGGVEGKEVGDILDLIYPK